MDELETLRTRYLAEIAEAGDLAALDAVRVAALGRKGALTERMKGLGQLQGDARREAGQALNRLKDELHAALDAAGAALIPTP